MSNEALESVLKNANSIETTFSQEAKSEPSRFRKAVAVSALTLLMAATNPIASFAPAVAYGPNDGANYEETAFIPIYNDNEMFSQSRLEPLSEIVVTELEPISASLVQEQNLDAFPEDSLDRLVEVNQIIDGVKDYASNNEIMVSYLPPNGNQQGDLQSWNLEFLGNEIKAKVAEFVTLSELHNKGYAPKVLVTQANNEIEEFLFDAYQPTLDNHIDNWIVQNKSVDDIATLSSAEYSDYRGEAKAALFLNGVDSHVKMNTDIVREAVSEFIVATQVHLDFQKSEMVSQITPAVMPAYEIIDEKVHLVVDEDLMDVEKYGFTDDELPIFYDEVKLLISAVVSENKEAAEELHSGIVDMLAYDGISKNIADRDLTEYVNLKASQMGYDTKIQPLFKNFDVSKLEW